MSQQRASCTQPSAHDISSIITFLVPRCKDWLTPTARVPCSNAAKTRNPLKLAGVPQTRQRISAVDGPKFTILFRHVEEILLFNKSFFRLLICALVADGDFLRPAFPASRVQHVSDLHSKFALGPHPICDG